MKKILFILFGILLLGCKTSINFSQKEISKDSTDWYKEDFVSDRIPGISLFKIKSKIKDQKESLIVAVVDSQIDTEHESLKNTIWTNKKEIPDNNIDDDHNGYIDDINGWNFLGTKSGNYIVWANFDYTRIVRKYDPVFKNKTLEEVSSADKLKYRKYLRAVEYQEKSLQYYSNYLKSLKYNISLFHKAKDTLKYFFPKEDYTYDQLDSLYKKYKINTLKKTSSA